MPPSSRPRRLSEREPSRPVSFVRRRSGSASHSTASRSGVSSNRTWYVVLGAVLLLANAVGYRIYRSRSHPASVVTSPAPPAPPAPAPPPPAPSGPSESAQALLKAHRLAALAAMEQGEYGSAERELLEAQKLDPGRSETKDLLRIVRSVQAGVKKAAAPPAPAPTPPPKPAPEPPKARPAPKPVAVARADPPRAPEPPAPGTLLVVSTPPGVLVYIDGAPADVTPARIPVPAGSHSVVLYRGDTRLLDRQVKVASGAVASVDADVSAQLAPKPASTPVAEPAEDLLPVHDLDEPPAPAPSAPAPSPAPKPAPPPPAAALAAGDIYVTSPEVYGEVFINGRRYGYPPLLAKGIPAGPATVEIRINDVPRRSTVVQVEPNKRLAARLR